MVLASLQRLVRSLAPFRHTGRWLDLGYGEGGLLEVVQANGWQCFGTEISPAALRAGEERGWVVTADGATDCRFPAAGFDVVTMIEVLEHLPAPHDFLRAAAGWLRPGGVLYFTTPNADSLNRRALGLDWSVVAPPEHLTLWTARGACLALAANGLKPRTIRTEGFNPSELLARIRPRKAGTAEVSRNEAGFALNETFSRGRLRPLVKRGVNHLLSLLKIGDTLKVHAVRARDGSGSR